MTMLNVQVFKGSSGTPVPMDSDTRLSDVRAALQSRGVVGPDTAAETWRFFNFNATSTTTFSDAIVGRELEPMIPVSSLLAPGSRLHLTNTSATWRPDLMGVKVDWFVDRQMGCQVWLNTMDDTARASNAGRFQPLMLSRVRPTSTKIAGVYDNVVVCQEGSVIGFNIRSWGPVGFGYRIRPAMGQDIASGLYILFGSTPNTAVTGCLTRYQNAPQQIVVVSTDSLQVSPGKVILYQRLEVRTWRVTGYSKDGVTYSSNAQPPGTSPFAGSNLVPGDTITPGTTQPGQTAGMQFGGMALNAQDDPDTQVLGAVVFYFFVFKSQQDANAAVGAINGP